jgi:hypothetical protein
MFRPKQRRGETADAPHIGAAGVTRFYGISNDVKPYEFYSVTLRFANGHDPLKPWGSVQTGKAPLLRPSYATPSCLVSIVGCEMVGIKRLSRAAPNVAGRASSRRNQGMIGSKYRAALAFA